MKNVNWASVAQIVGSLITAGAVGYATGSWAGAGIAIFGLLAKDFTDSNALLTPSAPPAPPAKGPTTGVPTA
jgi:hypothetical protein